MRKLSLALALIVPLACGRQHESDPPKSAAPAETDAPAATPVEVAQVAIATLADATSAPGETVALVEQQVRAPFGGTLTGLEVVEGDRVRRGQQIGALVARDSEAALAGAEEMARVARSPEQKADAERALELARGHRIEAPLLATVTGIVVRRAASAGDRVSDDQELVTIAAADSLVFRANVAQSELARIRPGQRSEIDLAGSAQPIGGTVHGLLAGGGSNDLTAPVRIDLARLPAELTTGLFGTARIIVAEHRDVPVVPSAAVLRDDISGVTRVGTVDAAGKLHWVTVEIGLRDGDRMEIASPPMAAGERVVVSGQVGLAEGTALAIRP